MKSISRSLLFLALIGVFFSCDRVEEPQLCSLYGVVTDKTTGEPIKSAGVELKQTGAKNVTGSDGAFEFIDLEEGVYTLFITKAGYKDFTSNEIAVSAKTQTVQHSIQLEKLPPSLTVFDENGNDLSQIDFGDNPADITRSFFIFNNGEEKLEWSIVNLSNWIILSKDSGVLKSNATQPLSITIDRNQLNMGDNSATIHILSNIGTKQINISAYRKTMIVTLPASNEQGNSAVLHGKITQDLAPSITEYGFVYSRKAAPTIENGANKIVVPGAPSIGAEYEALITDLEKAMWYYARAYATNGVIVVYGDPVSFQTKEGLPTVETCGCTELTSFSVKIQCKVTDNAGYDISARGVCYGLTPKPDLGGFHTQDGTGSGTWETELKDLSPNATYYVRAYATNENGTQYGQQLDFTTKEGLAVVRTGQVTNITSNSAQCSGEVVSDGDRAVIERGICWSTTPYPTTDNFIKADISGGLGQFSCSMTNLQPGTKYYVRAYARNSAGTEYGKEDVYFNTSSVPPTVTTQAASNITSSSANITGTITSTGGATITEAGFIYQAEGDYNAHSVHVQVSSGSFSYQLTDLSPGTKYYFKAYATNREGTGEGSILTFTTKSGEPQVSTVSSSNVGSQRATVTGKIISDGGFPITECGICYSSTNSKPTLSDNSVQANAQSGQYNCELTGLTPSTKYYARAYAKNANGTVYDYTSINFKTANGTPAVTIAQQPTYNGNTATVYGRITSDGGADITNYGVLYSTVNSSPSIEPGNYQAAQMEEGAPITNDFSFTVTGLPSGTMVYYRFFVVNSLDKIAYSTSSYLINF